MFLLFSIRVANKNLFEKEVFILFTVPVYSESLSTCVCASFPWDVEFDCFNS